MKKKYADYPNWERVLEKDYKQMYFDNDDFKGYVCLLTAVKVREKLFITKHKKEYVLIDDGYFWLQFFPDNCKNVALSIALTKDGEIREWYFDIAKNTSLTDKGVPYIDDLYLDVVLTPDGEIELLDEDELQEALDKNDINKEDFDLSYKYANKVMKFLDGKVDYLTKFTYKYYNYICDI